MFNYIKSLLTIVVLGIALCTACGGTKNESKPNEYPASVKEAFVTSCEGSGSDHEFCLCVFERVQQKYNFEEFSILEAKMKAGTTPPDFVEFIGKTKAECTRK